MLFFSQLFSDFGGWLDMLVLSLLVAYNWGEGAMELAALNIVTGLPWLFLSPIVGVWADRLPRRAMMLVCTLLRVLVVLGIFFAPNLYVLLPLVFLKQTLGACFDPARQGALGDIVPKEEMAEAVTLITLLMNTTKVFAPSLGGLLVIWFDAYKVILLEAVVLLVATLFIMRLPQLRPTPSASSEPAEGSEASGAEQPEANKTSFWAEFRTGLIHIIKNRILSVAISIMSVRFFIVFLYDGILVLWTKTLDMDESAFGMVMSAVGLGSVLGALLAGRWKSWKQSPLRTMVSMTIFCGLFLILIGFGGLQYVSMPQWAWIGTFLLLGTIGALSSVPYGYLLQSQTPSHLMGRIAGVTNSLQTGSMLLAPALGAILADKMGVGSVFAIAGAAVSALAIAMLLVVLPRINSSVAAAQSNTNAPHS